MDNTLDIKKRIHEFIDHADERILRIINAIITTEEAEEKTILEKKIKAARKEKKLGTLKTVNPNNLWDNIS